ncbi:MAG: ABC transporter ATP-binding protein [Spirochaetales bacterium]|nr:ABC transporter ATP-binding protein [Spirochaetales bacterium]
MIEIIDVSKTYSAGGVKAVDGMNLKIEPGKIFGFLGPNGAGKSTTIKMLTGLLLPDQGNIRINNIDILKEPIKAKTIIGYVPDEPVFYEKMSGAQFLGFIADIFRMDAGSRAAAAAIAEEFGIGDKLGEAVSSYSHGMKQKLSITAALMHNPEVFILDEPITGLDPQSAFILKTKMRELCKQGKTVFFSTHVMEVAEKICDEVGIINKGRIIVRGDLNEIRAGQASGPDDSLESIFLELTNEHIDIN